MESEKEKLIEGLFETGAIKVSPPDNPFWYTSGKIGPYYVNTHFLYGSEQKAKALLETIDKVKGDKKNCSAIIFEQVIKNYQEDKIFKITIDALTAAISREIPEKGFDYISGGERRDWFFSLAAAWILKKPHITLYKDLDAFVYYQGESHQIDTLSGAGVLHIADLITSASSYDRAWVPAIKNISGNMLFSYVIIDRMQGGGDRLKNLGVESRAMVNIDESTFEEALKRKYIDIAQFRMVQGYMADPDLFMKDFFLSHPQFLDKALKRDEKTAQRAKLCVKSGFYPIKRGAG